MLCHCKMIGSGGLGCGHYIDSWLHEEKLHFFRTHQNILRSIWQQLFVINLAKIPQQKVSLDGFVDMQRKLQISKVGFCGPMILDKWGSN